MGMKFAGEEAAYKFYYAYAKFTSFAIRKDEVRYSSNGEVKRRQFVCNKVKFRNIKHFIRDDRKKTHRPLTCTGFLARLCLKVDPITSRFQVVSFWEGHKHVLCEPNYVPLFKLYYGLSDGEKAQVDSLHAYGIRSCQIMGYMMGQKGGPVGMGFNKKDLFNYIEQ
ncbi:Protein FAR1-RELATED SEQUENCE 5 [Glycine max]|nr:Protein FAR1-RELATED SEQUENCE 5 [Glycine max]